MRNRVLYKELDLEDLNSLSRVINQEIMERGFWDDFEVATMTARDANSGTLSSIEQAFKGLKIALMHSELSEAMEGIRDGAMDKHLPERSSEEVELADTIIRILDYCGMFGIDIAGAIADKLTFNATREFKHGRGC